MNKPMISVPISESLSDKIDALAALTKRARDEVLGDTLESYVDEKVRFYRELDEAIREADESGEWISHEKMCAWLESWGTENELPPPEPDIFTNRK